MAALIRGMRFMGGKQHWRHDVSGNRASGAQFLNVIESVFSGMARAIIHNSDYDSTRTIESVRGSNSEPRSKTTRPSTDSLRGSVVHPIRIRWRISESVGEVPSS
jgi:hypothetical protein